MPKTLQFIEQKTYTISDTKNGSVTKKESIPFLPLYYRYLYNSIIIIKVKLGDDILNYYILHYNKLQNDMNKKT